jgi:hypothetical protein
MSAETHFYPSIFDSSPIGDLPYQGKSAEEIRRIFNIKNNDFSAEEEIKVADDPNAMS